MPFDLSFTPPSYEYLTPDAKQDIALNGRIAAISYIPPLCLAALASRRNSHFIRFHAKQATVLMILAILFVFLPVWLTVPLELLVFGGIITGFWKASRGEYYSLPLISQVVYARMTHPQSTPPPVVTPNSVEREKLMKAVAKEQQTQNVERRT